MIEFHYETAFELENTSYYSDWITRTVASEGFQLNELNYIFCDDSYLHEINYKYLNHDTFTDIIAFDYSQDNEVGGDIFISVERVKENAEIFEVNVDIELKRVMAHGVLHMMGYNDKSDAEAKVMRKKENEKMELFHVEQ